MNRNHFDFQQQPGKTRRCFFSPASEEALVSIITPFYNAGQYFEQTFHSVMNQTFPWFEWILVDDGSTNPDDLSILEAFARQDPRIRVLHKENGGAASARNYGIRHASTDLILPLDADDLLEPTFIEYCWWMLEKNPEAAWAYADSVGFQDQEYLWHQKFDPNRLKKENLLAVTTLIRKSWLEAVGCFTEYNRYYNEDWHLWLKLVAEGAYPVQCTGEYLFWYRRTDTGGLSALDKDPGLAADNKRMICAAADQITVHQKPVIYPVPFACNWTRPKLSNWEKCIRKDNGKKNILFLFPHLVMGGADKFNLDLISGLDPEKFDTGIITTIQSPNDWLQRFRTVTPNIFNLANFADPQDYAEFISYYIKSRQVDILFVSNSYHGYYLIPWLREHFPELAIVDYVHMEEWYWRNGGYARTSAMVGAITEKTYVCNSATRDVLIDHYGRKPESVETVYIGVDEVHFDRNTVQPGTLYKELGIAENRPVVLFICRLHPQKRPFLMLEIAKKVAAQIPEVAFAVVGDGPQGQELQQAVKIAGLQNTVFFLGARKEVRPYYRDARITLVCSLKEGLSLTAYESCAMGVPVVSSDVGGQRDLVDNTVGALIPCMQDEEGSLDSRVFPEEEIEAFTKAIVHLLKDADAWEEASRDCRNRICQGFTIGNMVKKFEQEFMRLTEDSSLSDVRAEISGNLQKLKPLAAELYVAEMQFQWAEAMQGYVMEETLFQKVKRILKEDGLTALIKKVITKIARIIYR